MEWLHTSLQILAMWLLPWLPELEGMLFGVAVSWFHKEVVPASRLCAYRN